MHKESATPQPSPQPAYPLHYTDLWLALAFAALFTALLLTLQDWQGSLRVAMSFVLMLFIPGYVSTAALFPQRVGAAERFALSLGLSVVAVVLVGLALSATPWGIQLRSLSLGLLLFVGVAGLIALYRRQRVKRVHLSSHAALLGAGALLITVSVLVGTLQLLTAPPKFTEFYTVSAAGQLAEYPQMLAPGERFFLELGIVNQEGRPLRYSVHSGQPSQAEPLMTMSLEAGERFEGPAELSAPLGSGRHELTLYLRRSGDTEPYRTLRLFLEVAGGSQGLNQNLEQGLEHEVQNPAISDAVAEQRP